MPLFANNSDGFSPNSSLLEVAIAKQALTQLNLIATYPRVGIKDYQAGAFERGDSVKIRRPMRRTAIDLNPRNPSNAAGYPFEEAKFFSGNLVLERLWTDGFMTYSYDSSQSIGLYVSETASQIADAIATPNDSYMYNKFRTWAIPSSGAVSLGDHPPIAISACVNSSGQISNFDNNGLRGATVFLDKENVPQDNRFCILSSTAKGAFLGDSVVVNGFAAASIGSGRLIERGLQIGEFVERYGFRVGGSNSVGSQTSVANLSTNSTAQADLAIASIADNTEFTYADFSTTTNIGAVNLTLTNASETLSTGVSVGKIARIGTASKATAFGVILRVNSAGNVVTLVPYAPDGTKLHPSQISTATDKFSIPAIPSVNTVNHIEGLAMATRKIQEPSPGSGAVAASVVDPSSGLGIQVFTGNYNLGLVRELNAAYMLTGSKITDFRKCGLILSL